MESSQGPTALHSGNWPRYDRAPAGHRGPWALQARAVRRSARLIAAAAGVQRLVWTTIANPGLETDRSYYRGRGEIERLGRCSGSPYAILRPACFFGRVEWDVLIQNVAWAARRLPWVPIRPPIRMSVPPPFCRYCDIRLGHGLPAARPLPLARHSLRSPAKQIGYRGSSPEQLRHTVTRRRPRGSLTAVPLTPTTVPRYAINRSSLALTALALQCGTGKRGS